MPRRVLIMGAAGRDFHNFNVVYRDDPGTEVVAFTATQIPYIDDRTYPAALAGDRYPEGIRIHEEDELPRLIRQLDVDDVVFAYSDVSHEYVMHKASEALAAGANFLLLGPDATMLKPRIPTVAVTAVRTGVGKSQTTRAVAATLKEAGKTVVAVRHPMPYGDLTAQRVQRFAELEDLDRHHCTIEEREEYEPHITTGTVIYAGVDYAAILEQAQAEGDVLLWDGGNNDLPFYVPDVHLALVDPLRVGHETRYHPGEANLRRADVIVINKIDSATADQVAALEATIAQTNPAATVVKANSLVSVDDPDAIAGKRVLVIEDGPTLTHGEMKIGAGVVAAQRSGAAEIVDPRPWAIGTIAETFEKYDVGAVLPAMGYSQGQLDEMAKIIDAAEVDLVVIGTPIDLRQVIDIRKPAVRVRYDLDVLPDSPQLLDVLRPVSVGRGGGDGTRRGGARRQRPAPPRGGRHLRRDVSSCPRRRGADRRHRGRGLGGRRHARERSAGRPDPDPAGGGGQDRVADAAGRLRRGEPGPDRLPAAGDDRRRVLRARDGASRGDGPVAHARPAPGPRVPQAHEVHRALLLRPRRRGSTRSSVGG